MTEIKTPVRVRFAPSPTGRMHLGSARTALYDFLIAKKTGGQFILRIEDTDRKRYVENAEQELIEGMHWLGMDWDEGPDKGGPYGPYRQSERKEIYLEYGRKLIDSGYAYYCFCSSERLDQVRKEKQAHKESPHYDGFCRNIPLADAKSRVLNGESHVLRFKSPQTGRTTVKDHLRGEITVENASLDDYILVKSDGWALYHLAAIVDDYLMRITHVLRSSEWLPSLPLHALIWRAFGWQEPTWVHLSVFLKPSGKGKMSKREAADLNKDGYSIFVKDLDGLGYLPEAVVNWSALMGWSYDDRTELFSLDDLCDKFSLERLNPAPAAVNFAKLDYFNKEHIKILSSRQLAERVMPFFKDKGVAADIGMLEQIAPHIKERMTTLDDAVDFCVFLFKDEIEYDHQRLVISDLSLKDATRSSEEVLTILKKIDVWNAASMENVLQQYLDQRKLTPKQIYSFLREAISGQRVTPPLFESMEVLGKERTIQRVEKAVQALIKFNS